MYYVPNNDLIYNALESFDIMDKKHNTKIMGIINSLWNNLWYYVMV
jgi:hypothetical protein